MDVKPEGYTDAEKEAMELSAQGWDKWAAERDAWADKLVSIVDQRQPPENPHTARADADLGRRVAKSIRLSIDLGELVCPCHMRPVREMLELERKYHANR